LGSENPFPSIISLSFLYSLLSTLQRASSIYIYIGGIIPPQGGISHVKIYWRINLPITLSFFFFLIPLYNFWRINPPIYLLSIYLILDKVFGSFLLLCGGIFIQ
jgi:hypothetical protein